MSFAKKGSFMGQKNQLHYYIGIISDGGMKFVTARDNTNRICEWDTLQAPMAFSKRVAEETAFGLLCNGYKAVVVGSYTELDSHLSPMLQTDWRLHL